MFLSSLLSSCSLFKEVKPLTCPNFLLNRDTSKIVVFKEGDGKDITDRILKVDVLGYDGQCKHDKEKDEAVVSFRMFVEAQLGVAAKKREQKISYFVAIPSFYPKKEGKKIFDLNLTFPENMDLIRFTDEEVTIRVPLEKTQLAQEIDVYYGLQLTKEDLLYNTKMRK
jgi:hypothetical protein